MLIALLVNLLIICLVLYLIFTYLIPLLPDETVRKIVTLIVVVIAIGSLLHWIPGWSYY